MNIHLHCLVLDGAYRRGTGGAPAFVEVPAPTDEGLQTVLHKIIIRMMKLLARRGVLVEEEGFGQPADCARERLPSAALSQLNSS